MLEYNAETESWSRLVIDQNEINIPEGDGPEVLKYKEPQIRYLHGMTYVPEKRSLYLYGGVGVNNKKLNDNYLNDTNKIIKKLINILQEINHRSDFIININRPTGSMTPIAVDILKKLKEKILNK